MTTPTLKLPSADGERLEQRDAIGRLIGLICRHGAPAAADMPRVLIAIDGSEVGDELVERALKWLQQYHWRFDVHLVLVRDFLGKEAAERLLEETARADSARVRERLSQAGIGYTLHVLMGSPAARIIERANALDAAMILMGTRGHGPIGSALLGSVAYRVVHESTIPVTVLRA